MGIESTPEAGQRTDAKERERSRKSMMQQAAESLGVSAAGLQELGLDAYYAEQSDKKREAHKKLIENGIVELLKFIASSENPDRATVILHSSDGEPIDRHFLEAAFSIRANVVGFDGTLSPVRLMGDRQLSLYVKSYENRNSGGWQGQSEYILGTEPYAEKPAVLKQW